jgi:hypothetical protein
VAIDESSVLQLTKAIGHHPVGEAGHGALKFAEASWPLEQHKQELQRPALG